MRERETRDDEFWRTRVILYEDLSEIDFGGSEWDDPTHDTASFFTHGLADYVARLSACARAEAARRRARAYLQRLKRPGLHNLEFGRCAGSYTVVERSQRWLEQARQGGFRGDKRPCPYCYTKLPFSYTTGKLIAHTPTGLPMGRRSGR